MTIAFVILSFLAGVAVERTRARYRVGQAQTARAEFLMMVGNPVDLEPCEFTHTWQVRR
ncbi:hypothetical protein [Mesorhizobium sp. B2-1-3A]|uniref:hypothetical protein n=1 Tax=Mesorhizobium sp. B2-1-3A TaxID=2589971 RepID=UPI0015E3C991|nr:hypothetical protein [Mesorhizobium sp. B2-1-3A]